MQIYFKILNKLSVISNFLAFFSFYLKNFPFWIRIRKLNADPDPRSKMNADPCGSGSTALVAVGGGSCETVSLGGRRSFLPT